MPCHQWTKTADADIDGGVQCTAIDDDGEVETLTSLKKGERKE